MDDIESQEFKVRFGIAEQDARRVLTEHFGEFAELGDIHVKPNPKPSKKKADEGTDIYVRDTEPSDNVELKCTGLWGDIREDTLIWTIVNGERPTYCAVSSATWILVFVGLLNESIRTGDNQKATNLAYTIGEFHFALKISKIVGLGWARMGQFERPHTKDARRAMEARMKENGGNKTEAAKHVHNELGLGHSVDSLRDLLRPKRKR